MFDWLIRKLATDTVDDFIRDRLPEMLDKEIPNIIEKHLTKRFAAEPDLHLTESGFGWAMMLALHKRWPDIDRKTAAEWMWEYIDTVKFGDPGYEWTARAADELAESYVQEFGEAA